MDPDEVARRHFEDGLLSRIISAWANELRLRGDIMRRRDRCFAAWASFAPNQIKLRKQFASVQVSEI
jgi:hypothetical protein